MFSHSGSGPFKSYNNGEERRAPKKGNLGHSTTGPFSTYKKPSPFPLKLNIEQLKKNLHKLNRR